MDGEKIPEILCDIIYQTRNIIFDEYVQNYNCINNENISTTKFIFKNTTKTDEEHKSYQILQKLIAVLKKEIHKPAKNLDNFILETEQHKQMRYNNVIKHLKQYDLHKHRRYIKKEIKAVQKGIEYDEIEEQKQRNLEQKIRNIRCQEQHERTILKNNSIESNKFMKKRKQEEREAVMEILGIDKYQTDPTKKIKLKQT